MNILQRIEKLNEIGVALSAEKDTNHLLEKILIGAKELTGADAGTIYLVIQDRELKFEIVRTDSLNIAMGGSSGVPIRFPAIPLYIQDNQPNLRMVSAYAVLKQQTINIPDAYEETLFDFSGTREFDRETGYRSVSFLTIPLVDHENKVIGVLQLINAKDPHTSKIRPFSGEDQKLAESLASQAAISLTKKNLIENLKQLFTSFIRSLATALDSKSPYTAGHCNRVPVLCMMLAEAACKSSYGQLKNFSLSEEDLYELSIAAWLHDCGKVTTPEFVVDKATKLESVFDSIHLIDTRIEVLKRDAEIRLLREKLEESHTQNEIDAINTELKKEIQTLNSERTFLRACNKNTEFMPEKDKEKIRDIAKRTWVDPHGELVPLLTEKELYNLCITKGTLNPEERAIINNHVIATFNILNVLPFPKPLNRVPEIAACHHERVDGKGYPRNLTREQLSIQARILAIADIFEALTAKDRPFRAGKKLSEALHILGLMKTEGHIDEDLFQVFIDKQIYMEYARNFLDSAQIDEVLPEKIPGYTPSPSNTL